MHFFPHSQTDHLVDFNSQRKVLNYPHVNKVHQYKVYSNQSTFWVDNPKQKEA